MAQKYPSWSPYAYTLDNPIKSIDPTGNLAETILDVGSVVLSAKDLWNEPTWGNAGLLALDVVAAAIPCVPALGIVRHAGKAAGVGKAVDKGTDAAKAVDKSIDATKAGAKNAKRTVDPSRMETHHRLPTEHKTKFSGAGLDIEDFKTPAAAAATYVSSMPGR